MAATVFSRNNLGLQHKSEGIIVLGENKEFMVFCYANIFICLIKTSLSRECIIVIEIAIKINIAIYNTETLLWAEQMESDDGQWFQRKTT